MLLPQSIHFAIYDVYIAYAIWENHTDLLQTKWNSIEGTVTLALHNM